LGNWKSYEEGTSGALEVRLRFPLAARHRQELRRKGKWRLIPRIDAIWQIQNNLTISPRVPNFQVSTFFFKFCAFSLFSFEPVIHFAFKIRNG
jgi:hypothetical protein